MSHSTPEDQHELRNALLDGWDAAAAGWGAAADEIREWGMPVSTAMIEQLDLQSGETVLELAAGPGDTGFLAAEMIAPAGRLISSDAAENMLAVARARATQLHVPNVEFKQLQLEWIDMETASVDAILCRWGVMLVVDPAAAAKEMRRVLKPGGRAAIAVWDAPELNPWVVKPTQAMVELGMSEPADPGQPGMFSLAEASKLRALLEDAGFLDVHVDAVMLVGRFADLEDYLEVMVGRIRPLGQAWKQADAAGRSALQAKIGELLGPFTAADGSLTIPGQSLVALAEA